MRARSSWGAARDAISVREIRSRGLRGNGAAREALSASEVLISWPPGAAPSSYCPRRRLTALATAAAAAATVLAAAVALLAAAAAAAWTACPRASVVPGAQ